MKKLLVLFLSFTFISLNAQTTTDKVIDKTADGIAKVYNDGTAIVAKTSEIATKLAPKVEQALNTIGQQLKVSANQVWNILIRQQLVWSLCYLMLTLSSIAALIHLLWRYKHNNDRAFVRKKNYHSEEFEGRKEWQDADCAIFVFSLAAWIALSIMSVIHFTDMLTGFINPEFGALKTIATIASQIQ